MLLTKSCKPVLNSRNAVDDSNSTSGGMFEGLSEPVTGGGGARCAFGLSAGVEACSTGAGGTVGSGSLFLRHPTETEATSKQVNNSFISWEFQRRMNRRA